MGNSKVFFFSRDEQAEILRNLGSIQIPHEISNASWAVVFVYCHPANEEGIEWLIDNNICRKIVLAIQGSLSNENESGKSILMRTLNITGG